MDTDQKNRLKLPFIFILLFILAILFVPLPEYGYISSRCPLGMPKYGIPIDCPQAVRSWVLKKPLFFQLLEFYFFSRELTRAGQADPSDPFARFDIKENNTFDESKVNNVEEVIDEKGYEITSTNNEQKLIDYMFGYSITVPDSWQIEVSGDNIKYERRFNFKPSDREWGPGEPLITFERNDALVDDPKQLDSRNDFNSLLQKPIIAPQKSDNIYKIRNMNVAGKQAIQYIVRSVEGDSSTHPYFAFVTWFRVDDINYEIILSGLEDNLSSTKPVYEQIVSTFSLFPLSQTVAGTNIWDTYNYESFGIRLRYPKTIHVKEEVYPESLSFADGLNGYMTISIFDRYFEQSSFKDWLLELNRECADKCKNKPPKYIADVKLGELETIKTANPKRHNYEGESFSYFYERDDKLYEIRLNFHQGKDVAALNKIFNIMLSTFEFVDNN